MDALQLAMHNEDNHLMNLRSISAGNWWYLSHVKYILKWPYEELFSPDFLHLADVPRRLRWLAVGKVPSLPAYAIFQCCNSNVVTKA